MTTGGGGLAARLRAGSAPASVVISGRFMSTIGYYLVIPFLTIHLIQDGITDLQAGLLLAMLNLTRRGLGIPAGWASDRFGAARVLTLGLAIEVVAYASFAGAGSFWTWAVGVTLLGTGGSLNNNGARTLLATSGSNGAAVNFSRYYVMINAAALIGPLVGSVLLARDLMWIAFLAAAVLHLLFAAVTALVLRTVPAPAAAGTGAAAIVSALRDRELIRYCAITVGGWFLITQFYVALPLTIAHQGLSTALLGPLNALNAAVVMVAVWLLSQRIAARSTVNRLTVLSFSGLVLAAGWVLCAISGLPVIIVAIVIVSAGESLFCAVVDVTAAALAPPGRSGLYLGFATMAWAIGGTLGSVTAGFFEVAARHGVLPLYWVLLASAGLVTSISTRLAKRRLAGLADLRQQAADATLVA